MFSSSLRLATVLSLLSPLATATAPQDAQDAQEVPAPGKPPGDSRLDVAPLGDESEPIPGERVDPETIPAGVVEGWAPVLERERARSEDPNFIHRARNDAQGHWVVPSREKSFVAHSGIHYATVKWGDPRIGIGLGGRADVDGAWIAGQFTQGVWTTGLVAVGFRDGEEVARTEPFRTIGREPAWFAMGLEDVDRIELHAEAVYEGAGFYGLDDLTFARRDRAEGERGETVVLDFEDLSWRTELTGSGYGGLTWETGTGTFEEAEVEVVHEPQTPPGHDAGADEDEGEPDTAFLGGGGTAPTLLQGFMGPRLGNPGAGYLPPDTCGAVGLEHYIAVVNQHISVYDKVSQVRLVNASLQSFFGTGGAAGDPRVVYDHFENRWVVIATNFNSNPSGVRIAYSTSDDATGTWFKGFIPFDGGSDSGAWCDYPTLGVDQNGIYMGAYMVGNNFLMSLFAVDKAPLLAGTPSIGTVSAWRQLPWEGALQPCVTHGTPAGEYVVSRRNSAQIRVRRISPPLTAPTMQTVGNPSVPSGPNPPSVPAQGSTVNLDTVGTRLMNAVYRNGSIWAAHTISSGGRAAARWYEFDAAGPSLVQSGTVSDPIRHYFFPAIAVNADDSVLLGFSASSSSMFAASWYTGRIASDPPGEMAPPAEARQGGGPYNQASSGTNRWGDYSLSNVDPEDDLTMWTIQEFARNDNRWGTWIARFSFGDICAPQASSYCATSPHSGGPGAEMFSSGSLSIADNDFYLEVDFAASNKFGLFYYGPNQIQTAFGDGLRCVGGMTQRLNPVVQTDSLGFASHQLNFTQPPANGGSGQILPDSTWNFQFWFRDPMGPGGTGFNLSDGLSVTFCE